MPESIPGEETLALHQKEIPKFATIFECICLLQDHEKMT